MKKENTTEKVTDIDYAQCAVPAEGRKGFLTMFMIMLGFTFFSASMWVGQQLAEGLDFYGFIKSLILGGMILGLYTGLLGYVGAKTGLSMDLLAKRAFGEKGSYISSAMISFTQIGWFGVGVAMFAIPVANELLGGSKVAMWGLVIVAGGCMTASAYFGIDSLTLISYIAVPLVAVLGTVAMILAVQRGDGTIIDQFAKSSGTISVIGGAGMVVGSFVSGGTATPNFARFAKDAKSGTIATVVAFFIGNSLMFFFGAIAYIFVGGNDIFEVMIRLNLFYLAILVLIAGIVGTLLSVWLYYNFCNWLNVLNCTLPPVGIILVISYFMNQKDYEKTDENLETVNWFAVAGVVIGAIVANVVSWGIASINGMVVAAVCYVIGQMVRKNEAGNETR